MLTQSQFIGLFPKANLALFDAYVAYSFYLNNEVMFLSQISEETGELTVFVENLNYSAKALVQEWPSHFTPQLAAEYAYQPEKIANRAYAGRMGNGDEASGDGWKYIGRGAIQLTGKNLYNAFAQYTGKTLDETVTYLTTPEGIIESAIWYWVNEAKVNDFVHRTDVPHVTQIINGGLTNLQRRYDEFDRISKVLV